MLTESRAYYRPFTYPWAYEYYKISEQTHWLPQEVELRDDINDWNSKLTTEEKNLLNYLFRFFTQADVDIASGYNRIYLPKLGGHPEVAMMMNSFAAREAVHIDAYSTLIETLGMPEETYREFMQFKAMKEKHDYLSKFEGLTEERLLLGLAAYSGFSEGMQLFSSFAILMNFERFNKMKGMCNIIRWSIRDESLHVEGMTRLFRELYNTRGLKVFGSGTPFEDKLLSVVDRMVILEDKFIDLCFTQGSPEGLPKEDLKSYIRFIANKRWQQLGFPGLVYEHNKENPLKWLDWVVNGQEHTNFFEARPTEYSRGTVTESEIQW